jgi:hypothetical protein
MFGTDTRFVARQRLHFVRPFVGELDLKASSAYKICSSGVREAGENPALPRNCKRGEVEKITPLG